ncbi:HipA N-terminal domain-containing protein [Phenylobacterium sp. 58.2.17]|uniref:HipA N-terminal domain-containing protein n=1 Tax=Phenylobacterium sp. 58.2.17 TaxID=2969306 RepID=UPI00226514DA|nr:HipA N-terminal domain-containing protein [Phenylobacterium sp. 58.2.17]MCX7586219.1 HipA N-terminal domain-containing protein [Phenylobacterium sp. 58.2.17]
MTSEPHHDEAYVWFWLPGKVEPVVAGRIARQPDGRLVFNYGRSYLARNDAISIYEPELPLAPGEMRPRKSMQMPSCLRDASPDAWGRRVIINRTMGLKGSEADSIDLDELTYLLESGSDRVWFYAKAPETPWLSMDRERGQWEALVFDATYLLANPLVVEATPDRATVSHANKRRRLSGAALVPPTRVLQLTRIRRLGFVAQATGLGSPKRPHERVGHERRLRNGRIIPVRACEIHKGCAGEPLNLVVRP